MCSYYTGVSCHILKFLIWTLHLDSSSTLPAPVVASNTSLAAHMLNSPTWTRVAVLRDPAERLLSAYLDKIHSPLDTVFSRLKMLAFAEALQLNLTRTARDRGRGIVHGGGEEEGREEEPSAAVIKEALRAVSFPAFVQMVSRQGAGRGVYDPHWRPQSHFCGLPQIAPQLDLVLVLPSQHGRSDSHSHSNTSTTQFVHCLFQLLVQKRKLDSSLRALKYPSLRKYTRSKRGGFKYTPEVSLLQHLEQIREELAAQGRQGGQGGQHNTGHVTAARQHMAEMYDAALRQTVFQLYRQDYQLLGGLHHQGHEHFSAQSQAQSQLQSQSHRGDAN